jgi:hypothetical protein
MACLPGGNRLLFNAEPGCCVFPPGMGEGDFYPAILKQFSGN